MSRRPARFTEADLRRAAKVAKMLGLAVEVAPDGTIRLCPVIEANHSTASPLPREIVL
jgi:hypothetical protein